eukprot:3745370-Prymnesium_polylepis.1
MLRPVRRVDRWPVGPTHFHVARCHRRGAQNRSREAHVGHDNRTHAVPALSQRTESAVRAVWAACHVRSRRRYHEPRLMLLRPSLS